MRVQPALEDGLLCDAAGVSRQRAAPSDAASHRPGREAPMFQWESAESLAHSILDACPSASPGHVSVGIVSGTRRLVACVRWDGTSACSRSIPPPVCLGCLAKVFTATLVADAVRQNLLELDSFVADRLCAKHAYVLHGITVRHLLNHTHGLDGAAVSRAPLKSQGRLDIDALMTMLAGLRRVAAPGAMYSYGNIGAWIAAAILERETKQPYHDLLVDTVLSPLGVLLEEAKACAAHGVADAPRVCPATGAKAALSVDGVLSFLSLHLSGDGVPASLREHCVRLPGWSPEIGASLGWKYYGSGWYGHNSSLEGCFSSMRVHPPSETGIVVASSNDCGFLVNARLFGKVLPEFRGLRARSGTPRETLDADQCVGVYGNAATSIAVSKRSDSTLGIELTSTLDPELRLSARLIRRPQGGFVVTPPLPPHLLWVEFVEPSTRGREYIWNGRELWRRT